MLSRLWSEQAQEIPTRGHFETLDQKHEQQSSLLESKLLYYSYELMHCGSCLLQIKIIAFLHGFTCHRSSTHSPLLCIVTSGNAALRGFILGFRGWFYETFALFRLKRFSVSNPKSAQHPLPQRSASSEQGSRVMVKLLSWHATLLGSCSLH